MLMGLSPGIDLALWLTGLTSGALNSKIGLYMMAALTGFCPESSIQSLKEGYVSPVVSCRKEECQIK